MLRASVLLLVLATACSGVSRTAGPVREPDAGVVVGPPPPAEATSSGPTDPEPAPEAPRTDEERGADEEHGADEERGADESPVRLDVIRVATRPGAVEEVPLEDYVAGVVGGEMPLHFPPEALKAQAVAARTYALAKRLGATEAERPYDIGATVLHQVYAPGRAVDPRARAAVEATRGEVLVFEHRPIEAFFHSTCGGQTEAGGPALARELPYLVAVECGRCERSPRARWTLRMSGEDLGRVAGLGRAATGAEVVERSPSGRSARVAISAGSRRVTLSAVDLRQRVGYGRLHSLWFSVRRDATGFLFEGRGSGHGAGLCQWGAAGFAREGRSYREILAHYYPGVELTRMY